VSSKRSPQTAAKRAREQQVREKRERKAAKKQARKNGIGLDGTEFTDGDGSDVAELDGEPSSGERAQEGGTTVAAGDSSPDPGEAAEPDHAPAVREA
jgi:hypothetical protein